uniref:Uncharacterized protein n=1 Tax=Cyanoptyche gloeocystis TaxID=77922 RepID=A0A6T9Z2D3_9EUKA|mmetsp:Transcript_841/g.1470  ORF Transcript_841/g.1470 Transcript_841/m.1470 type:complete len:155 (+) Transcript_841:31-495(+)
MYLRRRSLEAHGAIPGVIAGNTEEVKVDFMELEQGSWLTRMPDEQLVEQPTPKTLAVTKAKSNKVPIDSCSRPCNCFGHLYDVQHHQRNFPSGQAPLELENVGAGSIFITLKLSLFLNCKLEHRWRLQNPFVPAFTAACFACRPCGPPKCLSRI